MQAWEQKTSHIISALVSTDDGPELIFVLCRRIGMQPQAKRGGEKQRATALWAAKFVRSVTSAIPMTKGMQTSLRGYKGRDAGQTQSA